MRHVAAYLLAVLGGNANPSAKDIKAILSSVGVEADDKNLEIVINSLKGKKLEELIEEGSKKLASMPSGGGGGGAAPAAAAGGAPAKGGSPAKAAKEEKKKETPPESDEDMGMSLFD